MALLQRFLVAAFAVGAASTESQSLDALVADDECGESDSACALNALQFLAKEESKDDAREDPSPLESDDEPAVGLEAANYARRSTASLTCSQWGSSRKSCSGTIYGPCPGNAGGYYTCSGDWNGNNAQHSRSTSCNACGLERAVPYARWMMNELEGHCHGSWSSGGGHEQRTCIGRCRNNGGEYSCTLSKTGRTSMHVACSTTCTYGTLPGR